MTEKKEINRKVTARQKNLKKLHDSFEELRKEMSADIMAVCDTLPMSASEICRRVGISRAAWSNYKKNGLPFDKIDGVIIIERLDYFVESMTG